MLNEVDELEFMRITVPSMKDFSDGFFVGWVFDIFWTSNFYKFGARCRITGYSSLEGMFTVIKKENMELLSDSNIHSIEIIHPSIIYEQLGCVWTDNTDKDRKVKKYGSIEIKHMNMYFRPDISDVSIDFKEVNTNE